MIKGLPEKLKSLRKQYGLSKLEATSRHGSRIYRKRLNKQGLVFLDMDLEFSKKLSGNFECKYLSPVVYISFYCKSYYRWEISQMLSQVTTSLSFVILLYRTNIAFTHISYP